MPPWRREEFPSLAAFFRGYLHEDFLEVHGSVEAAALAFCSEASAGERLQVQRELALLLGLAARWPARDLRRFVTHELGSRWTPRSREQLGDLLASFEAR